MKKIIYFLCLTLISFLFSEYEVKVRDIVYVKGLKKNIVSGLGLVVGLSGTGDTKSELTENALKQYLSYHGNTTEFVNLKSKNTAVVAITSSLDGFVGKGDLVDLNVASIGDAQNILNGLLLTSVLRGGDGKIYVVGGGVVTGSSSENVATRGVVPEGGIIEQGVGQQEDYLKSKDSVVLVLKKASITTLDSIIKKIKNEVPNVKVEIKDYKQIQIKTGSSGKIDYSILEKILNLKITIISQAKVVIDVSSGIVVVGEQVRLDTAFVSMPGISIEIKGEKKDLSGVIKNNSSVNELASEFNRLGVSPKEMVSIFIALNKCGALNADIIIQ